MSTDVKDLVARLRVTWDVSEEAASALNAQASEIVELKAEARTFSGEATNNRLRAEAVERERDALKAENERLREALEHVTELLVDSWSGACDGDPEREVAVREARAALHPTQGGE